MNATAAIATGVSILVVDDDRDIREAIKDMLEHEGYRVDVVGTGGEGIELASQIRYGTVLLDIALPDRDGHAVLKALHEIDPQLPVIILTGHVDEQNTVGPLTRGAFASILKPYNPRGLKAIVRRACEVRALSLKADTAAYALSESEERFHSIVKSTSDAIVIASADGRIVFWNESASRMFLYQAEEIVGSSLTRIMPSRYRASHERGMARAIAGSHSSLLGRAVELEGLRQDGSEFPIELSISAWRTREGLYFGGIIRDITERKRAEAALRSSEERFRQLAENIKEVFWLSDAHGGELLYVSPAYEEIWGRPCATLYADPRSWIDAIHPDDRPRVAAATARKTTGDYYEEYRIIRPDGTTRWICDRAFPIRDEQGRVSRVAGIAECITAEKVAEQQQAAQYAVTRVLAEAGSLAEAAPKILEAIGEGLGWDIAVLWKVDAGKQVVRCQEIWHAPYLDITQFAAATRSRVFCKGSGLPGRVWAGGEPVWIPDVTMDPDFPRAPVAAALGLHSGLAFPVKLNEQVLGTLELFTRERRDPDQRLLDILGSLGSQMGQFAERREAQQAVRRAYDKLDAIMLSLPCLILIVDDRQRVTYANPLAAVHFKSSDGTLVGNRLQEVLPVGDAQGERLVKDLILAAETGKPVAERELKAGKRIFRYRVFPVTGTSTDPQRAGLVLWDVTEQSQLQDQLIQAEKLASLGTLVSGMAHEINNPVQGILGMAEIILNEEDPDKVKEYARDIVRYSEHVGMVVRNFACYARPASRDHEMEVDVRERLQEAVKLVQRCPQFGHVEVVTEFQPTPKFRALRTEIDQVFVNLISNAVEAMEGTGRLTLRAGTEEGGIIVSIADTGCGIPPSLIGKIFDPFVTTKEPGKGTGLGLSIVYKIVSKYGGRIAVDSTEGKGTTFAIHFPSDFE